MYFCLGLNTGTGIGATMPVPVFRMRGSGNTERISVIGRSNALASDLTVGLRVVQVSSYNLV
jgi:hypothetical protein